MDESWRYQELNIGKESYETPENDWKILYNNITTIKHEYSLVKQGSEFWEQIKASNQLITNK